MMKSADRFIIFVLVSIPISTVSPDNVINLDSGYEDTLQQVAILHRHGFRTPEWTYKTDPYNNMKKYWPMGWGQLLNDGKTQLYRLGKMLSKRYRNLISEYTATSVFVNSSDYDRCHDSVALLLAGWFPPVGQQIWSDELNWNPIPIHSLPRTQDRMLAQEAPCPRYEKEKEKVDREVRKHETVDDKKLYEYLTKHMGEPISDYHQLEPYYLTFQIEERIGYKLPKWLHKVYPEKIREKGFLSLLSHAHTKFMQRIMGGPWIKEVLHEFIMKSKGLNKDKKVSVFSAHDTTIANILQALQYKMTFWPGYGSALIFELHKSSHDDFFVKFYYTNNTIKSEMFEWKIPNCPAPCSLTTLHHVTKYMWSVDWDKDCRI